MTPHARIATLVAATVIGAGCYGETEWADDQSLGDLPGLAEDGAADGFGDGEVSEEKQAILDRMRARLPEVRRLKEDLVIGETHLGLLAVVSESAPERQDAAYAATARSVVAAENQDRLAFYEIQLAGYEAQIQRDLDEQRPAIRQQIVDELCAQLPVGQLCEDIAEQVIEVALEEALSAAAEAAMQEVRAEVYAMYGEYYQDRATRPGEWIEIELELDVYGWVPKAA